MNPDLSARLRSLPSVDRVLASLEGLAPQAIITNVARMAVDRTRAEVKQGASAPSLEEVVDRARALLDERGQRDLQPVINATGVLIHTNLGRVPLGQRQLDAISGIAGSYSNLEYDLPAGGRGSRYSHASDLISAITGADAALVVNNNAAAVLLTLAALATDKEVVISRGELIEIGGEFRMPDVMSMSGTRLVEVGTTNRTHLADYERAITASTGALLKVHPSNYKVTGFTAEVPLRELVKLARGRGVPLVFDAGSGYVEVPGAVLWAAGEPPVAEALAQGVDVITFSGDKLLGGPQAGIIAGRADLVRLIAKHPLVRALRVDKMTLAGLEATLRAHLEGKVEDLPLWSLALTAAEELRSRAERVAEQVASDVLKAEAISTASVTGGGSLPGEELGSWGIALTHAEKGVDEMQKLLRTSTPPVIARIEDERLLLDLRSVFPEEVDTLIANVRALS
ncbi:MAG: L-seryl-tRNA(Sec) selenium transferase [Actinomycetota bacterium]